MFHTCFALVLIPNSILTYRERQKATEETVKLEIEEKPTNKELITSSERNTPGVNSVPMANVKSRWDFYI